MTKQKGEASRSKPAALTSSLLSRKGVATTTSVVRFPDDDKPLMVQASDRNPISEEDAWTEELIFSTRDNEDKGDQEREPSADLDDGGPMIDEEIVRQVLGSDPFAAPPAARDEVAAADPDENTEEDEIDDPSANAAYGRGGLAPDLIHEDRAKEDYEDKDYDDGFTPQEPDPFVVFTPEFEALERRSGTRGLITRLSLMAVLVVGVTAVLVYTLSGDDIEQARISIAIDDQPTGPAANPQTIPPARTTTELRPAVPRSTASSDRPARVTSPVPSSPRQTAESAAQPSVPQPQSGSTTSITSSPRASSGDIAARSGLPVATGHSAGKPDPALPSSAPSESGLSVSQTDKPRTTIVVGEPGTKLTSGGRPVERSPSRVGEDVPPAAVTGQKAPPTVTDTAGKPTSLAGAGTGAATTQSTLRPTPTLTEPRVETAQPESKAKTIATDPTKTATVSGDSSQSAKAVSAPITQTASKSPADTSSPYAVQLLSLRSEGAATRAWERLKQSFPKLLDARSMEVQKAQVEGRGTFYRVRAGGYASRGEARGACAQFKAKKQDCLVVRR